jgi:hypothetical protein
MARAAVALSYAKEIAKRCDYPRVVAAIQARALWNDALDNAGPGIRVGLIS